MTRLCLAADSSQITQFLLCPESWHNRYLNHLQKKTVLRSKAMDMGTAIHGLCERFYHRLYLKDSEWNAHKYAILALPDATSKLKLEQDEVSLLRDRFTQYVAKYSNNHFMPLSQDNKSLIEVGFSIPIIDNDYYLFVLEGRIDLITLFSGKKVVIDHKSQSSSYDLYDYSIQFMNYSLATGIPYLLVNYIGLQKTANDNTFRQHLFYYNPAILRRWRTKLEQIFFQMATAITTNHFDCNYAQCQPIGSHGITCEFTRICESLTDHIRSEVIRIEYTEREKWLPWNE